jgi:ADP-ribose pyrophosphatase
MTTWKQLSTRRVLDHGKFLRVDEHAVALPDGTVIPDWPVVITPDYVNVLVLDRAGRFLLFRQTKYLAPAMTLSPPGGYLEPGEDPLTAAQRELREETGYTAPRWIPLGSFIVDSNRGCGTAHLFLALDAEPDGPPTASDDLEDQQPVLLTRAELEEAVARHACPILSAAALFGLGLRALDQQET